MSTMSLASLLLLFMVTTTTFLTTPSTSSTDTFIYGGCSQLKYTPGSPYESNVNSLLTSLVNSAMFSSFNKFTISTSSSNPKDTVSGLFQCRGDLTNTDCPKCVTDSVSQLGVLCRDSSGGAIQLEGCFVKYDNSTFLGVEDKTVVVKKCGPPMGGYDSDELTRRDAVLAFMAGGGEFFRVGESGKIQGVSQCVGDLSASECQDCLSEAIGRLRSECGTASWGDMFLAKCYARYSEGGTRSRSGSAGSNNNDDEIEKPLAILTGLIAAVCSVIIAIHSLLRKLREKRDGK